MLDQPVIHLGPESDLLPAGPGGTLAIPVEVVSESYVEPLRIGLERAYALTVTSPDDYKKAAELLNMLTKFDSTIKENVLALGRPFREAAANITTRGEKYREPIAPAKKVVGDKMLAWKREEDAKIAAAAEVARLARVAAEAEIQRQLDEKARLEREALAAEEAAAKKLENAKTDKAREKAIADAVAAQAKVAAAAAIPAPTVLPFVAQAPLPTATTAKGASPSKRVVLDSVDVTKLPAVYLLANEVLIKKHLADDVSIPGAVFHLEDYIKPTGR